MSRIQGDTGRRCTGAAPALGVAAMLLKQWYGTGGLALADILQPVRMLRRGRAARGAGTRGELHVPAKASASSICHGRVAQMETLDYACSPSATASSSRTRAPGQRLTGSQETSSRGQWRDRIRVQQNGASVEWSRIPPAYRRHRRRPLVSDRWNRGDQSRSGVTVFQTGSQIAGLPSGIVVHTPHGSGSDGVRLLITRAKSNTAVLTLGAAALCSRGTKECNFAGRRCRARYANRRSLSESLARSSIG